ncbi:MAG: phosphoribosylformylglycinamidine synthase subunit PurL [Dehalococcoidales bacterium]|nr:phosphoribosylformylglycinamidine synthase subunit PurL [Dehalococcoidales bacterium]
MHRVEVRLKTHLPDPAGRGLVKDIQDLGINSIDDVRIVEVYWLDTHLAPEKLEIICNGLLADTVTQDYWYGQCERVDDQSNGYKVVEVAYNPGVTDPVKDSVMKAILDLGIPNVHAVATAKRYLLRGEISQEELDTICGRLLVNPIVQHVVTKEITSFPENPQYNFTYVKVPLLDRNAEGLENVRKKYGFSQVEFKAVLEYFRNNGRDPIDVELETLAQTWSEHCVHKTFKGKLEYEGSIIDNLLKSTIISATQELNKPWCLSVFEDNAGVIEFDDRWALCFKVETHNHPSAVEPYGGASTGIGGVIRDPMGTGMGSKPILNTDVFCFAPPDYPYEKLPKGVLHPRRVFKGVRAGVADYANRMGIPTPNGAILFDERYVGNPLVFCGTLGLMPGRLAKRGKQKPGDLVVLVGGKTGRDGIHGVTFASVQLDDKSSEVSFSAVQIGNPIVEKKMLDVLLQARDLGLYSRITDCGGGGLSSAVGEMGEETGVHINLDKVPLKYAGLSYTEIWISESQERMILAVPPETVDILLKVFADEDVEAAVIGEFTSNKRLQLEYQGMMVCDLDMNFLHKGIPQIQTRAEWHAERFDEPDFLPPADMAGELKNLLGSWNTCSKEWVIRQYDHEVQGGSVLKPLVGANNDGPGDATVIRPVLSSDAGAIIANGINTRYGDIDPYWMAASAIDEALRQVIAVGGNLKKVALLDNFCWGSASRPDMLGALVRAAQACHDMSLAFGVPFISGKDSLNNEFEYKGKIISIPHTLLVSAVGVTDDVKKTVSMDLKSIGDSLYIIGITGNDLGGSEYFAAHNFTGNNVPRVDPQQSRKIMEALSSAMDKGLVKACHDCSEGGLAVAVSEMAFSGGLGATIYLKLVPRTGPIYRNDYLLFSESNSRFIVEISPAHEARFMKAMAGITMASIGHINQEEVFEVFGLTGDIVMREPLTELKEAWQKPLRW